MRIPRGLTIALTVIIAAALLGVGYLISRPRGPVVVDAAFGAETITPNADGDGDVTTLSYRVRREADVSIYFEDAAGDRYYFRRDEIRTRGEYAVLFGGVVEGYVREGEDVRGEVIARLLPDGAYTWVIEARDHATGKTEHVTGTLNIVDSDPILPDLWEFAISPQTFTPNQDGITDRVYINVFVPKPADLTVSLIAADGEKYYIPQFQQQRAPGEEGRHLFEWDGGVELGREPPPDGVYTVLVQARDAEGQRVEQVGQLEIRDGGVPLAEIVAQPVGDTLRFSAETVTLGDVLYFEVTIWNYGEAPIRTTGPEPGYIYEQDEYFASSGFYEESGAWRVGIHCSTCLNDYPWRWAVGMREELTPMEIDGKVYYYLMPGQRTVVHGGIRLTNIVEARNPQEFWVGLIHEDVGIASVNNRVDPHWIEIVPASEGAGGTAGGG